MNELPELFQQAQGHFSRLVHEVGEEQWSAPTPCSEWDVRALVNHLTYEARWAPPLLAGSTLEEVGDRFDGDLLGADPKASYGEAAAEAAAAIRAEGALDRTVHLSFGDTAAADYVTQLTGDFVVHAWDLARGIGADDTLPEDLVRWGYATALPLADQLAASGMFDPPVDVPDDADEQTKLLALFGRRRRP